MSKELQAYIRQIISESSDKFTVYKRYDERKEKYCVVQGKEKRYLGILGGHIQFKDVTARYRARENKSSLMYDFMSGFDHRSWLSIQIGELYYIIKNAETNVLFANTIGADVALRKNISVVNDLKESGALEYKPTWGNDIVALIPKRLLKKESISPKDVGGALELKHMLLPKHKIVYSNSSTFSSAQKKYKKEDNELTIFELLEYLDKDEKLKASTEQIEIFEEEPDGVIRKAPPIRYATKYKLGPGGKLQEEEKEPFSFYNREGLVMR